MWPISSLIAPWTSVIAATSRGGAGGLGEAEVEEHVGLAVDREVVDARASPSTCAAEPREVVGAGALGREHDDADLDRDRGSRAARATSASSTWLGLRRGGSGSATNQPPPRPRTATRCPLWVSAVSAWRSVEREMPICSARSRSGGSCAPGGSRPRRIAVPEPLDRLLERRDGLDGIEDRRDGRGRRVHRAERYGLPKRCG